MKSHLLKQIGILSILFLVAWSAQPAFGADSIEQASKDVSTATADANAAQTTAAADAKAINGTVKGAEDKLDDAVKAQDDLPPNATQQAKDDAQKNVDDAEAHADDVDKTMDQAANGKTYRNDLKARRDANKKLKKAIAELNSWIQRNNQKGMNADDMQIYRKVKQAGDAARGKLDGRISSNSATQNVTEFHASHVESKEPRKTARAEEDAPRVHVQISFGGLFEGCRPEHCCRER